jgi:hypothetical protein
MIMPRLAFEEPKGGPGKPDSAKHRREVRRDNVVVVLKAATFALIVALVGAGILLATTGGEEPEAKAPAVPEIKTSHVPSTTPSSPMAEIVAPEVRTQTAEITPTALPTTTTAKPKPPENTPPPHRDDQFAVVGHSCDTPGAYAFTERYDPVVCAARRNRKFVWRPVFE